MSGALREDTIRRWKGWDSAEDAAYRALLADHAHPGIGRSVLVVESRLTLRRPLDDLQVVWEFIHSPGGAQFRPQPSPLRRHRLRHPQGLY